MVPSPAVWTDIKLEERRLGGHHRSCSHQSLAAGTFKGYTSNRFGLRLIPSGREGCDAFEFWISVPLHLW